MFFFENGLEVATFFVCFWGVEGVPSRLSCQLSWASISQSRGTNGCCCDSVLLLTCCDDFLMPSFEMICLSHRLTYQTIEKHWKKDVYFFIISNMDGLIIKGFWAFSKSVSEEVFQFLYWVFAKTINNLNMFSVKALTRLIELI